MKLTAEHISRTKSGYTRKRREENVDQYLSRLTHLYLENKNIDETDDDCLGLCTNLSVLYLYENNLKRIPPLMPNKNLTHLYLQNNQIGRIQNLGSLVNLVKLYLGHNCIMVLEGLEKLSSLIELHIDHQKLPPGEKLLFDTRSLLAVSNSLQIFDISANSIDSIHELGCLVSLNSLIARDNNLSDVSDISTTLKSLNLLMHLDFIGNPICNTAKYRDRIILASSHLESLDNKEISKTSKDFVLNWYASRDPVKKRSITDSMSKNSIDYNQSSPHDLPPMEGPIRSYSGYCMPGIRNRHFETVLAKSNTTLNPSLSAHLPIGNSLATRQNSYRSCLTSTRSLAHKSLVYLHLDVPTEGALSRYQPSF